MEREPLTIDGKTFEFLRVRLKGGFLYATPDKEMYLRVNTPEETAGEQNITRELFERGFPVPEIVGSGTLPSGEHYFIERSLGSDTLGMIFKQEMAEHGFARDATFDAYIETIKRYCDAQFNEKNYLPQNCESLAEISAVANALHTNPPSEEAREAVMTAVEKASERLMALPWGFIQADLNPFNVLERGLIDFEYAHFGPVGYDGLTNVFFGRMWPSSRTAYRFTEEQVARYLAAIDEAAKKHGLPAISDFMNDFLLLKVIWSSGKAPTSVRDSDRDKDFWEWRARIREWSVEQYLQGKPIDTTLFESVGSGT